MIDFSKEEKEAMVSKLQTYFSDELDHDIGQFDAEFLLDFFAEEIGKLFYNRGLYDAQTILQSRIDNIVEAISELEKLK
jgi:uncharacterized protein (DUF2164 family)